MANKFSQQVNKGNGGQKPKVDITDLLADSGTDELVSRAKSEGRYLSLPVEAFVPDTNQPRKTFDQERIDGLRVSIESNGQLQPILVGDRLLDGTYPIIAGERRWRAIRDSEKVRVVDAIIRSGDVDELHLLLMQIDENNQREQIPAIENAMAMKRVADICRAEGKDQAYAAKLLNISPGRLSKHLALLDAPSVVTGLSTHNETQDVDVLYNLAKASEGKPEDVAELIDKWRSGELETNLRKASKELAGEAKQAKKKKRGLEEGGFGSSERTGKGVGGDDVPPKHKKASAVRLSLDNDEFMLVVEFGNKKLSFRLDACAVILLKGDIDKNWSE